MPKEDMGSGGKSQRTLNVGSRAKHGARFEGQTEVEV